MIKQFYTFSKFLILTFCYTLFYTITFAQYNEDQIRWITFEQAIEMNKKQPRKILIDVYTHWCGWCKEMDKRTFSNKILAKYVNKKFYAVKLNAEQKEDIIFNGKTFNYKPEFKCHEIALSLLSGKMSYPTTIYLDETFSILTVIPGFIDVNTFEKLLKYYGENHNVNTKWDVFQKKFVSKL